MLAETEAVPFLTGRGLTRDAARKLIRERDGRSWRLVHLTKKKGRPIVLRPLHQDAAETKEPTDEPRQSGLFDEGISADRASPNGANSGPRKPQQEQAWDEPTSPPTNEYRYGENQKSENPSPAGASEHEESTSPAGSGSPSAAGCSAAAEADRSQENPRQTRTSEARISADPADQGEGKEDPGRPPPDMASDDPTFRRPMNTGPAKISPAETLVGQGLSRTRIHFRRRIPTPRTSRRARSNDAG